MTDKEKKETINMIVNYMDNGFLDNITAMFKAEHDLYPIIADLIQDERMRVRIGVTAMMEDLVESDSIYSRQALGYLKPLLEKENPTLRGDAAYIIGLIGGNEAEESLSPLLNDPNPLVKEVVQDFFENR